MDILSTALFSLHSTSRNRWCVLWWGWGNKGGSVEHPWRRGQNVLNQDLLLWHFS